jgi:membrane AbrB-like protein
VTAIVTILAALVGAALFEALGVPAGALIGAMVAVAAVNLLGMDAAELPRVVQFLAFTTLGWLIGSGITSEVVRSLARNAGPIVALVVALLAFGGLLAYLAVRAGILDPATAFLATSPGGLSQMAAIGSAVGANAGFVVTVHLVRVVTVISLASLVVRLLSTD